MTPFLRKKKKKNYQTENARSKLTRKSMHTNELYILYVFGSRFIKLNFVTTEKIYTRIVVRSSEKGTMYIKQYDKFNSNPFGGC